jgi:signal transduction histidine kinase
VRADDRRLAQVLINLLSNAIRHTPAGGSVTVSVSGEREQALVTVRDTGEGIAAADLPHIFDRLYRADNARARSSGGTGLGLSIVRSLVEAHGGQIWVQSELDQGTVFGFTIPLIDTK